MFIMKKLFNPLIKKEIHMTNGNICNQSIKKIELLQDTIIREDDNGNTYMSLRNSMYLDEVFTEYFN